MTSSSSSSSGGGPSSSTSSTSGGEREGGGGGTGKGSRSSHDLMKYSSALNTCGITFLCLDLIAVGIDPIITTEAMTLLVALLRCITK